MSQSRDDTWKWFVFWRDGLACVCCGMKAGLAMEFHHVKPSEKRFTIASAVYNGFPLDTIREELEKCVPVCANCHKIIHAKAPLPKEHETREDAFESQRLVVLEYRARFRSGR